MAYRETLISRYDKIQATLEEPPRMSEHYEFVFSFRSPSAWIAAHHVMPMLDPTLEVKWSAFFPLPRFSNFGNLLPAKASHNIRDILRMTKAYQMKIGRPLLEDPDWAIPHSAFEFAKQQGRGMELAMALFAERWSEGEDIATDPIIARAAASVGLDAGDVVAASHDSEAHQILRDRIQHDFDECEVFGVPMLITPEGKRFWGVDRIEWAIRYGYVPGTVTGP